MFLLFLSIVLLEKLFFFVHLKSEFLLWLCVWFSSALFVVLQSECGSLRNVVGFVLVIIFRFHAFAVDDLGCYLNKNFLFFSFGKTKLSFVNETKMKNLSIRKEEQWYSHFCEKWKQKHFIFIFIATTELFDIFFGLFISLVSLSHSILFFHLLWFLRRRSFLNIKAGVKKNFFSCSLSKSIKEKLLINNERVAELLPWLSPSETHLFYLKREYAEGMSSWRSRKGWEGWQIYFYEAKCLLLTLSYTLFLNFFDKFLLQNDI